MRIFDRLRSSEVIRFEDGKAVSLKGRHGRTVLADIETICREFEISSGEIYLSGIGKLSFSADVPAQAHQPLRNVIVSQ